MVEARRETVRAGSGSWSGRRRPWPCRCGPAWGWARARATRGCASPARGAVAVARAFRSYRWRSPGRDDRDERHLFRWLAGRALFAVGVDPQRPHRNAPNPPPWIDELALLTTPLTDEVMAALVGGLR